MLRELIVGTSTINTVVWNYVDVTDSDVDMTGKGGKTTVSLYDGRPTFLYENWIVAIRDDWNPHVETVAGWGPADMVMANDKNQNELFDKKSGQPEKLTLEEVDSADVGAFCK